MDTDVITGHVVDAAVRLHMRLGPGLLESVYHHLMALELRRRGLEVESGRTVAFEFEGIQFNEGLRLDMLVNGRVVVELKSIDALAPVHTRQVLTYLRLLNLPVGLLINFGGLTLREGLRRISNNYEPRLTDRPIPRFRFSAEQDAS